MKQTVLLAVIVLAVIGCAGGNSIGADGAVGADAESGDGADIFGAQPGVSEDGVSTEEGDPANQATPSPPAPSPSTQLPRAVKDVEITKGSDLESCVIGGACERTISAKGGSGEIVWKQTDGTLPSGMEMVTSGKRAAKIRKKEGQEISEVGVFSFTLRAEDAADASLFAERAFTLAISEHIALNLFTRDEGEEGFEALADKQADGAGIVIPPGGAIYAAVAGHAPKYVWSINGQDAVCQGDACEANADGLQLIDAVIPPADHVSAMALQPTEEALVVEHTGVVISVRDEFGNAASRTITAVTFSQDPCDLPLVVNRVASSDIVIEKKAVFGKEWSLGIGVSGETGVVTWSEDQSAGDLIEKYGLTLEIPEGGKNATISGVIRPSEGMPLAEYKQGIDLSFSFTVTDECPARSPVPVGVHLVVEPDEKILSTDGERMIQELVIAANDTDDETTITASLQDDSGSIAAWGGVLNLDPFGDDGPCSSWDDCTDLSMENVAEVPAMVLKDRKMALDSAKSVCFTTADPGSGGRLDIKIYAYEIKVPYWTGVALNTGLEDDIGTGAVNYDIAWVYSCPTGEEGDDPCAPVRTREIGMAKSDGMNRFLKDHVLSGFEPTQMFTGLTESAVEELGIPNSGVVTHILTGGGSVIHEASEKVKENRVGAAILSGGLSELLF